MRRSGSDHSQFEVFVEGAQQVGRVFQPVSHRILCREIGKPTGWKTRPAAELTADREPAGCQATRLSAIAE